MFPKRWGLAFQLTEKGEARREDHPSLEENPRVDLLAPEHLSPSSPPWGFSKSTPLVLNVEEEPGKMNVKFTAGSMLKDYTFP